MKIKTCEECGSKVKRLYGWGKVKLCIFCYDQYLINSNKSWHFNKNIIEERRKKDNLTTRK